MTEKDLKHVGVKGMKWGVRNAAKSVGDWAKAAGRMTKNGITNPYLAEKANRESIQSSKKFSTKLRRGAFAQTTKEIQDVNARFDKLKSETPSLHKRATKMINTGKQKINNLSRNQKTALKFAGIVAGTAVSTYVAAKLSDKMVSVLQKASYEQTIKMMAGEMIPIIAKAVNK